MTPVPKISYVMPLRTRLEFTTNALPTILMHSTREHEVILVLDKCTYRHELARRPALYGTDLTHHDSAFADDQRAREKVYRWIDGHQKLLDEHRVRVLDFHGDETHWTGGLRAAGAMNMGIRASTSDWTAVFGDEDLVFARGWDAALWGALWDRDPMRTASLPVMVMPHVEESFPEPLAADWIHAQRGRCCHQLSYPIAPEYAQLWGGRITYDGFERFVEVAKQSGVHEERCGERRLCHWVPMLMHKDLFWSVGGYPTADAASCSFDITFDDALGRAGIVKRMPLDHMILHAKHFCYLSDEVDRLWGDEWQLGEIQKRMIP